jgi:hypothetical protein
MENTSALAGREGTKAGGKQILSFAFLVFKLLVVVSAVVVGDGPGEAVRECTRHPEDRLQLTWVHCLKLSGIARQEKKT